MVGRARRGSDMSGGVAWSLMFVRDWIIESEGNLKKEERR